MAGREALVEPLILITGDDFEWFYDWKPDPNGPPQNFPAGLELFYEFKNGPNGWIGGTVWNYVITETRAAIKRESEIADAMKDRTPYRLKLRDTTTTPTTEKVLVIGLVKRQEKN
ncbi:LtfC-like domain-containing protein [Nocardia goodfellowii]